MPGLAFVIAEAAHLTAMDGNSPSTSLDLYSQWRGFETTGQWRFTPPTQVVAALDAALNQLDAEGGVAARGQRYGQHCAMLVAGLARLGFQIYLPAALQGPAPRTPVLRGLLDEVRADPTAPWTVDTLADRAGVSPRHLTRLFREELGTTPAKHLGLVRFDLAKAMLDAGHSVTRAAELAGFGTSEALRRSFVAHLGVPPSRYQHRFRSTAVR